MEKDGWRSIMEKLGECRKNLIEWSKKEFSHNRKETNRIEQELIDL